MILNSKFNLHLFFSRKFLFLNAFSTTNKKNFFSFSFHYLLNFFFSFHISQFLPLSHLLEYTVTLNLRPAVGDPASAGGLDSITHRGPFQSLPFCDSVTKMHSSSYL